MGLIGEKSEYRDSEWRFFVTHDQTVDRTPHARKTIGKIKSQHRKQTVTQDFYVET